MQRLRLAIFSACLFLVACTAVQVKPLDSSLAVEHVCIEDNPNVKLEKFRPAVEASFKRHQISTEIFSENPPEHCEVILSYTAIRTWVVIWSNCGVTR